MHNSINDNTLRLQEFAEYLLRNQLARECHARYYVFWVRRFLEIESADPKLTLTERVDQFLLKLQAEQFAEAYRLKRAQSGRHVCLRNHE